jgi:hypothetical protein
MRAAGAGEDLISAMIEEEKAKKNRAKPNHQTSTGMNWEDATSNIVY